MFSNRYGAFLEKEVQDLKEKVKTLEEQNSKLIAALVAKESPVAYAEHFSPQEKVNDEARKRMSDERNFLRQYTQAMEGPLFTSVEDVEEALALAIGPPTQKAVHDNTES